MLRRALYGLATAGLLGLGLAGTASAQDGTGTLKMRITYGGDPPVPAKIDVNKDVEFCGKFGLVEERLVVNPENKGIKDIVVYVYTGRGGTDLPEMDLENETLILANDQCRFAPHVVIAKAGDLLQITNPDEVGHNANISAFANQSINVTLAPGAKHDFPLENPERGPMKVECNIHPWMTGWVFVQDHPFIAKSNENGELEIKGLPTGDVTFRIWAEAADGAIKEVQINGKSEKLRLNRFELDIEEGENDLGTFEIPADAFDV
jgi:plastocyanin